MLEACRAHDVRMLMLSTDEVYGPGRAGRRRLRRGRTRSQPASPYAASKAAADLLCSAYVVTYGAPVTIVRGTNAFGPRQIERVVPTFSICALEGAAGARLRGRAGSGASSSSSRIGCDAALTVLEHGEPGGIYNIGGGYELENVELARRICALAGAPESQIAFVADRPGHDFRYGVAIRPSARPRAGSLACRSTTGSRAPSSGTAITSPGCDARTTFRS